MTLSKSGVLDIQTETTETLDDVSSTNGSQKAKAKAAAKCKLIATHFQPKQAVCSECWATGRTFKSIYSNSTAAHQHWFNTLPAKWKTKVPKQIEAHKKEAGPKHKIDFNLGEMKAYITVESGVISSTRKQMKASKTGAMTAADAATATIAFMALKANRWAGEQEATMNAAEATTNTSTEWRPQNNLRVKHCFFERVPWHKLNAGRIEPDEGGFLGHIIVDANRRGGAHGEKEEGAANEPCIIVCTFSSAPMCRAGTRLRKKKR